MISLYLSYVQLITVNLHRMDLKISVVKHWLGVKGCAFTWRAYILDCFHYTAPSEHHLFRYKNE